MSVGSAPESGRSSQGAASAGPAEHAPVHRIGLGIAFMLLATSLFPIMTGLAKLLTSGYEPVQIVWARLLGHLVVVLILFMPRHGLRILRTRQPGAQMTRSAMQVLSTLCYFTALAYVPLAEAAAISFASPLIVTVLAVPILGETIRPARLLAVVVGLIGVLVVMQPGSALFQWASLLLVASALFYSLYQIFTRRVAGTDPPATSVVYSALLGTIVLTVLVPFFWTAPASAKDGLILASLGVFGGLGHYCLARAMTYAPANIVSPFTYFQLLGSVVLGYLLFGDLPSGTTWLGAAIIVASGLVIGWSASRRT